MPIGYNSPGVRVTEIANPSLIPSVGLPTFVCVIGTAKGKESATDRITLPAQTTTVGTQVLPVSTLNVVSTADFPSSGSVTVGTQTVTYTGKTATSFTGASGGTGSQAAGTSVFVDVAVTLKNTGVDSASAIVKLAATLETINPGNYSITVGSDPNTGVTGDEPYTLARIASPSTTPTTAVGAAGQPTGTYVYAVSFVRGTGTPTPETGLSPASSPVVLAAQKGSLTAIPVGPTGTTARYIYRKRTSVGGDSKFHYVGSISDNSTTVYLDDVTNAAAEVSAAAQGTVGATAQTGLSIGDTVFVTYDFTDNFYYEPTLFDDFADVVDKYGDAFAADGSINSSLTYAARLVLDNGANEVICLASSAMDGATFGSTLDKLKNEHDIGFVVPISGDTTLHSLVSAHCSFMNTQGFYRIGLVGQDSSSTAIAAATLRTAAQTYNTESMVMVSPSSFKVINPVSGRETAIGSQYAAAAVAGMAAARDPHIPLTRKVLAGFRSVVEKRTESEKVQDAAAGLLVIEDRQGVLRVRHGITTAVGNVNTKEISVVRAKYELARRLRDSVDRNLIGIAAPLNELPLLVQANIAAVLEQLAIQGLITGWGSLTARSLSGDPTTVEARFEYIPIYPLNNVEVRFRINTEAGIFSIEQTT